MEAGFKLFKSCEEKINYEKPICIVGCLGLVSLVLTVINVVAILIFAWLILWLKEVTPESVPQSFPHFWKTDIKNYKRQDTENEDFAQTIVDTSVEAFDTLDFESESHTLAQKISDSMIEKIKQDDDYCNISKMNMNTTGPAHAREIKDFFKSMENISRFAPMAENMVISSASGEQCQGIRKYSGPPIRPNLHAKLYDLAKLLITTSRFAPTPVKDSLQQPAIGTTESLKHQENETRRQYRRQMTSPV